MNRRDFMTAASVAFLASCTDRTIPPLLNRRQVRRKGPRSLVADVVVYGATPAGVAAAYTAARNGAAVVLVGGWREKHLGGMMSGGLGWTDFQDFDAFGGFARKALVDLHALTEGANPRNIGCFDPMFVPAYFWGQLKSVNASFVWSKGVESVSKLDRWIQALRTTDGLTISGRAFIDASYEGDLMKAAGVSYNVGRGAASSRNEADGYRGLSEAKPKFRLDPFIEPGNPDSGLLANVRYAPSENIGQADNGVQAYTFRMIMTNKPDLRIDLPASPPPGYDPARYEVIFRYVDALVKSGQRYGEEWSFEKTLVKADPVSEGIYDVNNRGHFSTDAVGLSWAYPDADYAERERIWKQHEEYVRGFFYALAWERDPRVPAELAKDVRSWGLVTGHFDSPYDGDEAGWPYQLYVREARRMSNGFEWSGADLSQADNLPSRSKKIVALASYMQDSHAIQNLAGKNKEGEWRVFSEGGMGVASGGADKRSPLPYEIMVPHQDEIENLLVPFCVASSHQAFSSIRMEPTSMAMGEAAGLSAALATADSHKVAFQSLEYQALRQRLLDGGTVLNERSAINMKTRQAMGFIRWKLNGLI